jgi:two-component system, OmpR family, sensor histidine kinase BaeS
VRLRLFHKLFLLVAGSALLAALAMAIVLSLNLKRGFADYLDARDSEQLRAFAGAAANAIQARSDAAAFAATGAPWHTLIEELAQRGDIPDVKPGTPFPGLGKPGRTRPRELELDKIQNPPGRDDVQPTQQLESAKPRRVRRPPPDGFAIRLMLFDLNGQQLFGPAPARQAAMIEQAIVVAGQRIAIARLLPRAPIPRTVDASFLRSQYRSAGLLTLMLLVLASIAAFYFARSGAARLLAMQRATTAIASGDLSSRVQINGSDEISAMGQNINSMAQNLQQLDNARRRWLAEISHELRTPLSVIVGELDALRLNVRPLTMTAVVSLSEEAQRIERIVSDLHFLALSDLSGVPCQFAPCDAVMIVNKVTSKVTKEFVAAGIDLDLNLHGLSALPVVWDAIRITQLLGNLLSNSLRYTDAPGKVVLTMRRDEKQVFLTLNDSAPGVGQGDLARIFEPLFRLDSSRARVSGGSGLGLAVSQSIVRAHAGSIQASASALGGLCMEIMLPIDASDDANEGARTQAQTQARPHD